MEKMKNRFSFEIATIFVFLLVLVSNLMVIEFAKGYFEHFDIPFALVNFSPQMYDYVRIAIPAIVTTLIFMFLIYALLKVNDTLSRWVASRVTIYVKCRRTLLSARHCHPLLNKVSQIINIILRLGSAGLLIYIVWMVATRTMPQVGISSAQATTSLASISKPNSIHQEVIVYRDSIQVILKTYNTRDGVFDKGYRVAPSDTYTANVIPISQR